MYISRLILQNYRNYVNEVYDFSDGINIISGGNAQGKTNAAEALFYLCTGYSPRVTREKQVINYNAGSAKIKGIAVSDRMGEITAEIEFFPTGGKRIAINGVPAVRIGELIGNINSVMFDPRQLKLVQESPEDRRRFMDIALSQINRSYFYALQKYRRILAQRNTLLKERNRRLIVNTIPAWDEQFVLCASAIIHARNEFLSELKPLCEEAHDRITGGEEKLEISGECKFAGSREEIADLFLKELSSKLDRDIEAGFTTAGPHRDDIKIKIDGVDARIYGSQGQQRTAALSLKIAEVNIFRKHFGEYPVFILDDAMSELDGDRRKRLMDILEGVQVIVTCTDAEMLNFDSAKYFSVSGGKIIRQS